MNELIEAFTPPAYCSICAADFDLESEGGMAGWIGILPVAFCPTCYAGICDMVDPYVEEEE